MQFLKDFITTVTVVFFSSFLYSVEALSAEAINSATEPSLEAQLSPKEVSDCSREDMKSWPLPMMSIQERETRLKWFSQDDRLSLSYYAADFDPKQCTHLLEHLQAWKNVTVLRPTHTSFFPNEDIAAKIISSCPNLDLNRAYYRLSEEHKLFKLRHSAEEKRYPHMHRRFNSYTSDPAFLNLSRSEKEMRSKVFDEAVKNLEYYDLSRYLGAGVWGYFAAAALTYKKDQGSKEFRVITGGRCLPSFQSFQKVIDSQSCEIAYDPYQLEVNLSNVQYRQNVSDLYETIRTVAFVNISGDLYRIVLEDGNPLHNLAKILRKDIQDIYVDIVKRSSTDNSIELQHICSSSNLRRK